MNYQISVYQLYNFFVNIFKSIVGKFAECISFSLEYEIIVENILIVGPGSLSISLVTAFFVSMVFTLQIVKEFLYLNAISLIGAILTISFVRELSPVLTSVIVIGRIGSCFTAELATMKVTEQIDALYLLNTSPIKYLIIPRVISCVSMLPILSLLSFVTSIASSAFICFTLYNINPNVFLASSFSSLLLSDILKSLFKTIVFGLIISIVSCYWGLIATGGAKGVGQSTTASVVTCLLAVFISDFLLSYFMFDKLDSSIKAL